jgi:thiol-disulfide isomerase/thioredoxin
VDLEGQIDDVSASVGRVATDIATLGASTPPAESQPAPSIPAGYLPRHVQGQQDTALGLTLGSIEGPDAYTGAASVIEPADGTKRIWMVWAHWCPYCQQELPELSSMYAELQATFPSIEIATVTTSIDPERGNPLDEYLAEAQFPFPVVVDDELRLAGKMGVSAFPFWLVTDGDGTVLLRLSGYLEPARVMELASTLDGYES